MLSQFKQFCNSKSGSLSVMSTQSYGTLLTSDSTYEDILELIVGSRRFSGVQEGMVDVEVRWIDFMAVSGVREVSSPIRLCTGVMPHRPHHQSIHHIDVLDTIAH